MLFFISNTITIYIIRFWIIKRTIISTLGFFYIQCQHISSK